MLEMLEQVVVGIIAASRVIAVAIAAAGSIAIVHAMPWPAWAKVAPKKWEWTFRFFVSKWRNCLLCQNFWHSLFVWTLLHIGGVYPLMLSAESIVSHFVSLLAAVAIGMWWTGKIVPDLVGGTAALDALLRDSADLAEKTQAK